MYHRFYAHLVWATAQRDCLIDRERVMLLERLAVVVCRQERATCLAIGAVATHVHLAVRLHPTTSIPRLVGRLKASASRLADRDGVGAVSAKLRWARGYSLHSVGERAIPRLLEYLARQPVHHPAEAIPGWHPRWLADLDRQQPPWARG